MKVNATAVVALEIFLDSKQVCTESTGTCFALFAFL